MQPNVFDEIPTDREFLTCPSCLTHFQILRDEMGTLQAATAFFVIAYVFDTSPVACVTRYFDDYHALNHPETQAIGDIVKRWDPTGEDVGNVSRMTLLYEEAPTVPHPYEPFQTDGSTLADFCGYGDTRFCGRTHDDPVHT